MDKNLYKIKVRSPLHFHTLRVQNKTSKCDISLRTLNSFEKICIITGFMIFIATHFLYTIAARPLLDIG